MLFDKTFKNFYAPGNDNPEPSADDTPFYAPGTVVIPEQTVETVAQLDLPVARISCDLLIAPDVLTFTFEGNDYTLHVFQLESVYLYGELDENHEPVFDAVPFIVTYREDSWILGTPSAGTYTISAKIPGTAPKILSFPKGRTIVSELSRLNKAFGNISKKQTIIGQLSDIADAAEAGKIGGGVPPYTMSDENKVLTVELVEDGTQTVTIIQYQDVEYSSDETGETGGQLAKGTYDDSTLENDDAVTVVINNQETVLIYDARSRTLFGDKSSAIDATINFADGVVIIAEQSTGIVNIGCEISGTKYKAEAKWSKSVDIPEPTAADDGKFLGANRKTIVWSEVPNTLPSYSSSDNGKVLGVYTDRQTGKTTPIWVVKQSVPNSSSSDAGKILAVNSNGSATWENRHSDEFLITITLPPISGMPYTCDKTADQIKNAFDAGKIITGRTVFEGAYNTGLVTLYHGNSGLFSLTLLTTNGNAISAYHYDLTTDTITYKSVSLS